MSIQLSTAIRDALAAAIESTIGAAPKLRLYTGAVPANCGASAPAGLLATIVLPSDWLTGPSAGAVGINGGPWAGSASAAGVALSYRIYDNGLTTCGLQGTVSLTGAGGDMTLDNTNITSGQAISITSYGLTMGGA